MKENTVESHFSKLFKSSHSTLLHRNLVNSGFQKTLKYDNILNFGIRQICFVIKNNMLYQCSLYLEFTVSMFISQTLNTI